MQDLVLRQLRRDIATALPPGAVFSLGPVGDVVALLHPGEMAHTARMSPPRLREFAAGRFHARAALGLLGIGAADLPPGRDRSPAWPPGVTGSISHAAGLVMAVVAHVRQVGAIGVDLEPAEPLEPELVPRVCRPEELAAARGADPARHAKLVFSAKESVYKCVAPASGVFLEFEDLEIVWQGTGRFGVRGHGRGAAVVAGRPVRGAWVESGGFCITTAWQPAADGEGQG